ncbi:MAG: hypothetical protein Q9195_004863 [Heterodermia aff. obscurata]
MTSSISSSIIAALKSFNEFIQQIKAPDCEAVEGLSIRGWEDELGRLRVWAANIGAHQTNQSSLDFRLRDASHVREQIIKLLHSLNRRLDDAREVLQEADDEDSEVSSDAEQEVEKLDLEPEMLQMQHSAAAIINRLFQMSILVRKPAQVDHRVRSSRAEVAAFEPFDYGHVRDKFPRAEEALISRLGSAITTRRMYLKYRERHAAKLKQGINGVSTGAANEGSVAVLSDTMATNLRDSNIDFDEKTSESGESSTSYAATLMSGGAITVPPPPIESQNGNPFECSLCFHIIKIESTKSWIKHVFLDLQPYICLDINCATSQKLYATRRDWLHHMKTSHTEGTGLRIVTDGAIVCPLCAASFNDEMQLAIHSARHLQDLALFVLPQSLHDFEEDDEEEESRPNLEKQAHSSDQYASTPNSLRIQGLGQGSRASSRNSRSPLSDLSVGDKSATKVLASTDDEADVASNKSLDQNDEGEWNHRYPDEIHATSWRHEDNFTSGYRRPTRSGQFSVEDPDGQPTDIDDNPQPLHHMNETQNEMEGAVDAPVAGVPISSQSSGDLRNASTDRSPEDRREKVYLRTLGDRGESRRIEADDPQYSLSEQFRPQSKEDPPTSTYWSVPEQTDFIHLIHHFGTNWQAIADHMKTKTQSMIKNYYHRQVVRGDNKLMEQALAADKKIKRGENMGQLPPPTIIPKRRYDTGPSIVHQRQLASSVDHNELTQPDSQACLDPHLRHAVLMDKDNPPFAPSNEETFHEEEVEYDGDEDLHEQDAVDSETSESETGTGAFSLDLDKHYARKMRHDADTEFERYGERSRSPRQKSADVEDVSDASSYAASQVSRGSTTAETKPIMPVVNEIERYALKTREIREKRTERLQQLKEKKTLGAKTPLQDVSRDNELRYGSQEGQMLAKHGIDPANLSEALFASFQSQNPAVQEESIQVYLQNLARTQRKDASLSNAETMSESRSTATPALDHPFERPPPRQGYSSHNVSSAGNSKDHSSGISKAITEREKEPQRDEEYYYERRTSEVKGDDREDDFYKERHRCREVSPGESVSQVGRQRGRDRDYSSDDSIIYKRRETHDTYEQDEDPNHRYHLAEGALAGFEAAELLSHHKAIKVKTDSNEN